MCWPQRRPDSLSIGAGGPMGVLGIRGSVGIRRRVLYVYVGSSVVECLTRDREAAGLSLTSVTALWSLSKTNLS